MKRLSQLVLASACLIALQASAAGDDELTALLRRQTDLGSDAGQRGEQATVDSFLNDEVIFSGGDGSVSHEPKFDKTDSVAELLKRQTLAFLEAGQQRDLGTMRRYLDDKLLFINEDGELRRSRDFTAGAPAAPAKGMRSSIRMSEWVLHHQGDVAVASYVTEQSIRYDDQAVSYTFLAVDIWIEHGAAWKLIGSETIPLHLDPPARQLPPEQMSEYAGAYSAGAGSSVVISSEAGKILVASNGGKPAALEAEVRDVFFRPGMPAGYAPPRIIFHRDSAGLISGYNNGGLRYAKCEPSASPVAAAQSPPPGPLKLRDFVVSRSGDVAVAAFFHDRDTVYYGQTLHQTYRSMETWLHQGSAWKMVSSQGRAVQSDPPAIEPASDQLSDYIGTYALGGSLTVKIARAADGLTSSTNGAAPVPLRPEARDVFFTPGSARTMVIFTRGADGEVSSYLSRRDERDLIFTKRG